MVKSKDVFMDLRQREIANDQLREKKEFKLKHNIKSNGTKRNIQK